MVKSSPNSEELFQKFEVGSGQKYPVPSPGAFESTNFSSGGQFWKLIQGDPTLKREFDQLISEKVNTRLETQKRDLMSQLQDEGREIARVSKEKGHLEGLDSGRQEGQKKAYEEKKDSLDRQIDLISQCVNYLVSEKKRMLRSHEQSWLEALEYILIQCLVPRASEILKSVHQWIDNELSEFGKSKMITLSVSPAQFADYQTALAGYTESRLSLAIDDHLALGDLRVEMDNGGIFFSDREALARLREVINQAGISG